MNILFLFHSEIIPHKGGVQRVTDILAKELIKRGHLVIFLSTSKSNDIYNSYSGFQEYALGYKKDKDMCLKQYLHVLDKHKINVVINQEANKESLFLLKNTPKCIKTITVFHNRPFSLVNYERRVKRDLQTNNYLQKLFKYFSIAFPFLYRYYYIKQNVNLFKESEQYSDKICLLSSRFFKRVKDFVDINDAKLVAISNPNTFTKINLNATKENLILYIGRLCETPKNVKDFISVWNILQQKNPEWEAKIVGDGPDRTFLESYAKKIKCKRLTFEGSRPNVEDYYTRARFVCLTSIYEGWGMVLTEGMAYGCIPCTYDTYETAHDIIDNHKCGLITSPLKPIDMANKIQQIIDNPKQMECFSKRATQKVNQFSVESTVDKWEELLTALLNESI